MFDGHPAYWFRLGRARVAVYADNGQAQRDFPAELNLRTAAAFAGEAAGVAKVEAVTQPDQWTVGGIYRRGARLAKYSWPDGRQAYVSGATGEVVQYTTRAMRIPLAHGWDRIPHCSISLRCAGTSALALHRDLAFRGRDAGSHFGIDRRPDHVLPLETLSLRGLAVSWTYAGTKRLHMTLGLFFGLIACTWAFSGMLSMNPFGPDDADSGSDFPQMLSGEPFAFEAFDAKDPREALRQIGSYEAKVIEFMNIGGRAFYLATSDEKSSRVIPMNGEARSEIDRSWLMDSIAKASQPNGILDADFMNAYDAYYLDRHHNLPLPALRVRLNDQERSVFYIDPRSGRRGRLRQLAMDGAMGLPRAAFDQFAVALQQSSGLGYRRSHADAGRAALCVTSVVIGAQFIRRKL